MTLADSTIIALRAEAGNAGDSEQVAICDRALTGETGALEECARVISAADAMGEEHIPTRSDMSNVETVNGDPTLGEEVL